MTPRGYLWENLPCEVREEFAQVHPFVQMYNSIPFWQQHGWHIEGSLGDMSGVRKSFKYRRTDKSTIGVKELREKRKSEGLCIECEQVRDIKSKNYCVEHREKDRLRAENKRNKRKREQV